MDRNTNPGTKHKICCRPEHKLKSGNSFIFQRMLPGVLVALEFAGVPGVWGPVWEGAAFGNPGTSYPNIH
eukprot:1853672-Rhodomonas_salina.3